MTAQTTKKWSDEATKQMLDIVDGQSPVLANTVEQIAEALGFTTRSVASKLRQLDHEVASLAKEKTSAFSTEQSNQLSNFVQNNAGTLTYKEIAEQFQEGVFSAKQIQGKLLAMELTGSVKAAEKAEVARTYSEVEEATFISMSSAGSYIEEIAATLNKTIASVRGKALSLTRKGQIEKIPAQKQSHAKESNDPIASLGDKINGMTVAEIAVAVDKTERGMRTLLTRRGIKVSDYDGASKKAKAEAKASA